MEKEEMIEKARQIENLTETNQQNGLFVIEDAEVPNRHCAYYLDLRKGKIATYGYNEVGEKMKPLDRDPKSVKKIKTEIASENCAKLSEF